MKVKMIQEKIRPCAKSFNFTAFRYCFINLSSFTCRQVGKLTLIEIHYQVGDGNGSFILSPIYKLNPTLLLFSALRNSLRFLTAKQMEILRKARARRGSRFWKTMLMVMVTKMNTGSILSSVISSPGQASLISLITSKIANQNKYEVALH